MIVNPDGGFVIESKEEADEQAGAVERRVEEAEKGTKGNLTWRR